MKLLAIIKSALTKDLPFWLSPAGLIVITSCVALLILIFEPIISDNQLHPVESRKWIIDKVIYISSLFLVAYWAQSLLHKNTSFREKLNIKTKKYEEVIESLYELSFKLDNNEHVFSDNYKEKDKLMLDIRLEMVTLQSKCFTYSLNLDDELKEITDMIDNYRNETLHEDQQANQSSYLLSKVMYKLDLMCHKAQSLMKAGFSD